MSKRVRRGRVRAIRPRDIERMLIRSEDLLERGAVEDSRKLLMSVLSMFQPKSNTATKGVVLLLLCKIELKLGRWQQAGHYGERALAILRAAPPQGELVS